MRRLSEIDFLFFIGSIIAVIGGGVFFIFFTWMYFVVEDKTIQPAKLIFVQTVIIAGVYTSIKHIRYCIRTMKGE